MDYSRYLVLYSGGADSTYFIMREETAKHLLHYRGLNCERTKVAYANAMRFGRHMTVRDTLLLDDREFDYHRVSLIDEFHALTESQMVLHASTTAIRFGMRGIVLCYNRDDSGLEFEALAAIARRAQPEFEILTPLREMSATDIREELKNAEVPYVSCMVDRECGHCPRCIRGY